MMNFSEVGTLQRPLTLIWAGNKVTSSSENTLRNIENTLECVGLIHNPVQCFHKYVGFFFGIFIHRDTYIYK